MLLSLSLSLKPMAEREEGGQPHQAVLGREGAKCAWEGCRAGKGFKGGNMDGTNRGGQSFRQREEEMKNRNCKPGNCNGSRKMREGAVHACMGIA